MDYQKREQGVVKAIKNAIPRSLKQNMLKSSQGFFSELYENNEVFPNHYMACAIDGVGTKLILAQALNKYDTVGIDLVAMSANDLATYPKMSPFLFIDYLAVEQKIAENHAGEIIKGVSKGLSESDSSKIFRNSINVNFGKGETASVDELMSGISPGYGFDIAGGMIGFIPKKNSVKVQDGNLIIALPSSGLHSNGYTDARHNLLRGEFETRSEFKKLYTGKFKLEDKFSNSTIGEELLTPTRIYVKDMARVSSKFEVLGINNTGYGLKNLNRAGNFEFIIDDPIIPLPIFELIQRESNFSDKEMYQKFNMGMGFFILANKNDANNICKITNGKIVGKVKKSSNPKTVLKAKKDIVYKGY